MVVEEHYLRETPLSPEKEQGFEFYLSIIKRRWAFFLIPLVIVLCASTLVAMLMRPIYRSEARILVQSQQIPLDLVRPTVTASAEERIQVIAQRIMTRDNLMAIVNKFQMFPSWRTSMSDSDLVDLMRERASITPIALNFAGILQPQLDSRSLYGWLRIRGSASDDARRQRARHADPQ